MRNNNENREWCKSIALRLEAIAEGRMYKCPECGEYVEDNCLFCECGAQVDLIGEESEPWEEVSFYDYFEGGIYDVEFRIGSDREFRSVKIMVACGGPNIFIDTAAGAVQLFWWTDRAEFPIDPDTVEAINEWAEEWYHC
jgi:predicted RNA-binding Zn-ribbon protein involved in translation (DUF1610 family)